MANVSKSNKIKIFCLALICISSAFGVAFQNIAFTIFGAYFLLLNVQLSKEKNIPFTQLLLPTQFHKRLFGFGLIFIVWQIIATIINQKNPLHTNPLAMIRYLMGNSVFWLGPFLMATQYRTLNSKTKNTLLKTGLLTITIMGAVALSQYAWGWRIQGIQFAPDILRPRGFYSHPLTFAYGALMVWPFVVGQLMKNPKRILNCAAFIALIIILWTTVSRTVQIIAVFYLFIYILLFSQSKTRTIALSLFAAALFLVTVTPNPVRSKFIETFSSQGVDKFSAYPDDRIAFWHAHALIIAERPLLGHGINLDTAYRTPYYETIGLADFTKKYEAHSQLMQIAAESGLVGLSLFLAYLSLLAKEILVSRPRIAREDLGNALGLISIFLLSGLTQNAFQDAEVRYILCLLLGFFIAKVSGDGKTSA